MVEVRIGKAVVRVWPESAYLETIFPDGSRCPAAANHDDHSEMLARELGCMSTWELSLEHELLHSLISVARGYPYSPTLHGVAIGKYAPRKVWQEEESAVLAAQAWLVDGKMRPELVGLHLDKMKARLEEIRRACGG